MNENKIKNFFGGIFKKNNSTTETSSEKIVKPKSLNTAIPYIPQRIVEFIHEDESCRSYACSIVLDMEGVAGDGWYLREVDDFPFSMRPWIKPIIEHPAIKEISIDDNTFKITVTDAYYKHWGEFRDFIVNNINQNIFGAVARVEVDDERPYEVPNIFGNQGQAFGPSVPIH